MHINKQKKGFLEVLEANMGNISKACKACKVSRSTIYNWKKLDPEFEESMSDINEGLLDLAESKLLEKIKAGHLTAIIFFLKTQAKKRGYIESNNVLNEAVNKPIRVFDIDLESPVKKVQMDNPDAEVSLDEVVL